MTIELVLIVCAGRNQEDVAQTFCVSNQTVWESVVASKVAIMRAVSHAPMLRNYTTEDMEEAARGFSDIFDDNGLIGVIGCSHFDTVKPFPSWHGEQYFCDRIGEYTVKAQLVVDSKGIITEFGVGCPGAMDNASSLAVSGLRQKLRAKPDCISGRYYLIGDNSYPICPFLRQKADLLSQPTERDSLQLTGTSMRLRTVITLISCEQQRTRSLIAAVCDSNPCGATCISVRRVLLTISSKSSWLASCCTILFTLASRSCVTRCMIQTKAT